MQCRTDRGGCQFTYFTENYSSGWRGSPAKGVGQVTGARVQISYSPPWRIPTWEVLAETIEQRLKILIKTSGWIMLLESH